MNIGIRLLILRGPSHAEEVGLGVITGLMVASKSREHASAFMNLFASTSISVFYSDDVLGVQIASALKNIFAIAFGILDEYKSKNPNLIGNNTESFLFSVSLNDMKNIAFKVGDCSEKTFLFLAGSEIWMLLVEVFLEEIDDLAVNLLVRIF